MLKKIKKQNYVRSFFLGMSTLILPIFFHQQDIPKIKTERFSDLQKLKRDYTVSISGIQREVKSFAYRK